jgi:SulP family sulfate permease
VPVQHGLYAMIVPTIVAALIRSSPFLITGATNTSALVIGALVAAPTAISRDFNPVAVMLLITLLMGVIQVLSGALRLGGIGKYVSRAVLLGFTFGAGLLIITGQLKNVLGLKPPHDHSPLLLDEVSHLFRRAGETRMEALAIAAIALAIVALCARISKLIPGAFLAIAATGALAHVLNWNIDTLGDVPRSLPTPTLPPLNNYGLVTDLLGPSLAVAILGMVEAISIGKALSAKARIKFHPNQELVAKGAGNIAGAFFGCMPTSASWTRSVINLQMGAKTRWVGVIAGLTVLLFVLALAPLAHFIPKAALGAIVIWIAFHMFDLHSVRHVLNWSRRDGAVMLITFGAILVLEIQYAIYLGVIASLLLLIHSSAHLHMIELAQGQGAQNQFRELEFDAQTGRSPLVLLQLEGDLFFGVAEELEEKLEAIAKNGAKIIVIRMKRTHELDATTMETLTAFALAYRQHGGRLIFCGLKPEMMARISGSELEAAVIRENLFPSEATNFGSVTRAVDAAKRELRSQGLSEPFLRQAADDQAEAVTYSI